MAKALKLISLVVLLVVLDLSSVSALSITSQSGLAVSPAVIQIHLTPDQNNVTSTVTLTNNGTSPIIIRATPYDFTSLNQTGSVQFIKRQSTISSDHGLSQNISISPNNFALQPNSNTTITLTINSVNILALGGHYGAVVFNGLPLSIDSSKSNQLNSNAAISTLVFLTTASGGTESISLGQNNLPSFTTHLPQNVAIVFSDTGNTQITPRGRIDLLNSKHELIGRGIINQESGLILPGTTRLYSVSINYYKMHIGSGKYAASINYQADSKLKNYTYTKQFVYLSRGLILLILIGILVALIVVGTIIRLSQPKRRYRV